VTIPGSGPSNNADKVDHDLVYLHQIFDLKRIIVTGKIFINYRRVESVNQAQHLKTLFDKAFGVKRVFLDVRGIDGGANWLQTLERQVAASAAMVVLIGKDWADLKDRHGRRRLDDPHDFVRFEISQALVRHLPVIPVSIDGAAMPEAAQLPANLLPLSLYQAMPLRTESFTEDAQVIAERLRAILAQRQQGVPVWGVGGGVAAALIAGIAVGPMMNWLGITFPGVTLLGDAQLRAERDLARNQLAKAEGDAKAAQQHLAEAESAVQTARDVQQSLLQRVTAAERERDEARREVATEAAKLAVLEKGPGSNSVSQFRDCSDCPEMVVVPAGKFMMGSANGTVAEKPVHVVAIPQPFAVGKYEVTFAEWEACVAGGGCTSHKSPSDMGWGKGRHPVINVSWNDAKEYVSWLSRKSRHSYRLLTEAEWEYAARAGSTSAYAWGDNIGTRNANCDGCGSQWDNKQTAPVGSFAPNAFGLHDMHGNVWEWCEDNWHADYTGNPPTDGSVWRGGDDSRRVLRGGSWMGGPRYLRSASRHGFESVYGDTSVGFRVARTL
jgi:formylglycine-generating enzyme required for sulfatase activity